MPAILGHYRPNPDYGAGVFRRRIVRSAQAVRASAALLDDFHDMTVALTIRDGIIADARGQMTRYPKTTCPGAAAAVSGLRGGTVIDAVRLCDRASHCTHLLDLARLALSWHAQARGEQVIEIALTDRDAQRNQDLHLLVDGAPALSLALRDEAIVQPAVHRGRGLFGGFGRWVAATFAPDDADLWRMAQMAVFVGRGRACIVDGPDAHRVAEEPAREGACFSFSGTAFAIGRDNVGYVRDWSKGLPPVRGGDGKSPGIKDGGGQ
jgi:hypothetical protein